MPITLAVRGDHVQLDHALKIVGLTDSGGAAHAAISAGGVRVDGEVETRKRAKLRPGQRIDFADQTVVLVAE